MCCKNADAGGDSNDDDDNDDDGDNSYKIKCVSDKLCFKLLITKIYTIPNHFNLFSL